MHRFDAKNAEVLISKEREKIQPIKPFEDVLRRIDDKNTAVDFGAGIGYFTVVLAEHFRRVFAVEAQEEMAEKLRKRLDELGIRNVGIIVTDKPIDFDFEVDFLLFANVLHEVDDWKSLLEWSKIAKYVAVIDWKKEEMSFGPPVDERIDERDVEEELRKHFSKVEKVDVYRYHYFFLCSR